MMRIAAVYNNNWQTILTIVGRQLTIIVGRCYRDNSLQEMDMTSCRHMPAVVRSECMY